MSSRHSRRPTTGSRPRESSNDQDSGRSPEILRQLGRAVLSYSLRRLSQQNEKRNGQDDPGPRQRSRSSRRWNRDASTAGTDQGSRRDLPRGDSDMHNLLGQAAVGIIAFGVRQLVRRRREAKRRANKAAAQASPGGGADGKGQQQPGGTVDHELLAALDSVSRDLQGASDSIGRLAYSAPSHRNCEVRDALAVEADRLHRSLGNMQASINNMRNLHPGLDQGRRVSRPERTQRRGRAEKDGHRRRTEEPGGGRRERDYARVSGRRSQSRGDQRRRSGHRR